MERVVFLEGYLPQQLFVIEEKTSINNFIEQNNLQEFVPVCEQNNLNVGDYVIIKRSSPNFHIVKPNETLKRIANLYNVTEEYLKQKNKISELFIGQKIVI